jgi:hypothetical protein
MSDQIARMMQAEDINPNGDKPDLSYLSLPKEVWEAREEFRHVFQAARSTMMIPDFLLGCVLARVSLLTPRNLKLPATIGASGSGTFDWYVACVGRPGEGKSSTMEVARELLPLDEADDMYLKDGVPLGTGEGILEAFLAPPVGNQPREQAYHGILLEVDEATFLLEMGDNKKGSILMPLLRSGYMGNQLGTTNADPGKRRLLRRGEYRLSAIMNFQPPNAATILNGVDTGTPQRFHWMHGYDFGANRHLPDHPGKLPFRIVERWTGDLVMECDKRIADEVKASRLAYLRNEVTDEMAGHDSLGRMKMAGLIAVLCGNVVFISHDDWLLAGMLMDVSRKVREYLIRIAVEKRQEQYRSTDRRVIERTIAIAEAKEDARVLRMAATIMRRLMKNDDGFITISQASQALSSDDRHAFEEAIDIGVSKGMFVVRDDGIATP